MKLIIDIPEMYYKFCTECVFNRTDTVDQMYIANGTPYEERPHGEWIMNKTSARGRNYTCTNCKKVSRNKFDFCPNCGADMRKADND